MLSGLNIMNKCMFLFSLRWGKCSWLRPVFQVTHWQQQVIFFWPVTGSALAFNKWFFSPALCPLHSRCPTDQAHQITWGANVGVRKGRNHFQLSWWWGRSSLLIWKVSTFWSRCHKGWGHCTGIWEDGAVLHHGSEFIKRLKAHSQFDASLRGSAASSLREWLHYERRKTNRSGSFSSNSGGWTGWSPEISSDP